MKSVLALLLLALYAGCAAGNAIQKIPSAQLRLQNAGLVPRNIRAVEGAAQAAMETPPDRISVVILNWKRPSNVIRILGKYVTFDAIDEVSDQATGRGWS